MTEMRIVKQEKAPCFTKNVVWVHFRKKKLVAEIFDRGKWRDLVNNDIDFELSNDPNTFLNGDGKFTNIALLLSDNEDLSAYNENGVVKLKFNNRKPSNTGSKGYVILRKNKTINDQILEDNTIYEIRYDFDLNGDNIQLPNNVVLRFNGGSFKNGTVFGTGLAADAVCGNIFNKFPSITGTGNVVINNNHYYESIYNSLSSVCYFDVQTKDEISTYVTFPEINGTIKIYDNVYASIDIQHRFSDGSLTIYYSNVTIDTDVIFNLQNEIKYYRFVNSDGKINLIDNYGNIVMDNGRYDKIYENERLQIACKISSDNKEKFFYITFKKPMLINLRTAPSNIGIIKTIIENKYNIGEYKFDKTLKKPLWWNGAAWVDANGVAQ